MKCRTLLICSMFTLPKINRILCYCPTVILSLQPNDYDFMKYRISLINALAKIQISSPLLAHGQSFLPAIAGHIISRSHDWKMPTLLFGTASFPCILHTTLFAKDEGVKCRSQTCFIWLKKYTWRVPFLLLRPSLWCKRPQLSRNTSRLSSRIKSF